LNKNHKVIFVIGGQQMKKVTLGQGHPTQTAEQLADSE
jgi:hypothetical protein